MTDPQVGMLMLGLFIVIVMLGFPMAFTLVAMGVGFGYYAYAGPDQLDNIFNNRIFSLLFQKTFEVTSSDVLTAIPLFLFMGYMVERANILDRLFHSLQIAAKNIPGSLAVATLARRDRGSMRPNALPTMTTGQALPSALGMTLASSCIATRIVKPRAFAMRWGCRCKT